VVSFGQLTRWQLLINKFLASIKLENSKYFQLCEPIEAQKGFLVFGEHPKIPFCDNINLECENNCEINSISKYKEEGKK
jgi:hypothetical protein